MAKLQEVKKYCTIIFFLMLIGLGAIMFIEQTAELQLPFMFYVFYVLVMFFLLVGILMLKIALHEF